MKNEMASNSDRHGITDSHIQRVRFLLGENMATKKNTNINGNEYFRIRRTIDGRIKNFYGSSKGDAERKYKEYLEELAERKYQIEVEESTATFGDRAKEYIENFLKVSQKYAKGTIQRYIGEYERHIKGTDLDGTPLKDIRATTIQQFYNSLDISQHSMKELNKFMSNFCKWIQLNGYSDNFLTAVELPKKKDNSRHDDIVIWEDKEIREILRSMNCVPEPSARHRQFFLVHVLLYTGMRISEALGLKYTDIRDGVIHIDRQWYLSELKPPKWGSTRTVPLHHRLSQALKAHEEWHRKEMKKNGYNTEFVFTTSTGRLYHQASVRKALERFYADHGIPYKHMHAYRATFCTQMCRCGVPLEVTSKLMGHKSLEVTAAHYALIRQDTQQEAIERLIYRC